MKHLLHIFTVVLCLFLSSNLVAQPKNISGDLNNFDRETSFYNTGNNSTSLTEFPQNEYNEVLNKATESTTPPDSIIANLGNGKSEKHTYTYDTNGSLIEDFIRFRTNIISDSVYRKTFEYDVNRNQTLELTQAGWSFGWEDMEKIESEYNENGDLTMRLWQKWDHDNSWINSRRNSDAYNTEGKRTVSLTEVWDGTKWVPSARYTNEYDVNGNRINDIIEFENGGILENWRKSGYTYDSNNNIITSSNFWWDNGAWFESYKYIYEYDSENRILSSTYLSTSGSDSLEAKTLTMYDYTMELRELSVTSDYVNNRLVFNTRRSTDLNTNGDRIYIFSEKFNVDSLRWENQSRANFNYSNDGIQTSYLFEVWVDSTWVNAQRLLSDIDLNGNNTYQSMQYWDNGVWVPSFSSRTIVISDKLSFWFLAEEVFAYYGNPATAINGLYEHPTKFSIEQNYPNPFNPTTRIKYQVVSSQNVLIKVFDALGNEITTLVNEQKLSGVHEVEFNAAGLSSGIYFYSVQTKGFFETKKMMLIK